MTCDRSWFSPGTPVSSTNKTDRHDITEILLKGALNTINSSFLYMRGQLNKALIYFFCRILQYIMPIVNCREKVLIMLLIVVSNYYGNTTGVTSGAGTVYSSRAPEFTRFLVRCALPDLYFFGVEPNRSLCVLFFFWPLCCLSFELRILIILWVSSSSSLYQSHKILLIQNQDKWYDISAIFVKKMHDKQHIYRQVTCLLYVKIEQSFAVFKKNCIN